MSEFQSFIRPNNILWMDKPLSFIHSSIRGHLGCLPFLPVVNKAAGHAVGVQLSVGAPACDSSGHIAASGIAGSHSNYMFNLSRHVHTVFYGDPTTLHAHQQYARISCRHTSAHLSTPAAGVEMG